MGKNRVFLPVVCVALAMVSCINDNSLCVEDRSGYDPNNNVWLSFNIAGNYGSVPASRFTDSRADDKDSHPSQNASVDENAVNPDDVVLMLLDNNGNVARVFDRSDYIIVPLGDTEGAIYRLKVKVNMAYFDYAPGETIPASFLMVTNAYSTHAGAPVFPTDNLFARSATAISQQHYSYSFEPSSDSWRPDSDAGIYIPMSGLKHFTLFRSRLHASTADSPYDMGEANALYLQRAMLKVRIVDKIADDANMEITGFRIDGMNIRGALMPDFVETRQEIGSAVIDWANGTEQVEIPTVRPEWYKPNAYAVGSYVDSENSFDGTVTGVWTIYIPEYSMAKVNNASTLTIFTRDTKTGEGKSWTYSFPDDLNLHNLTRNHIYEFMVQRSSQSLPTLKYTVCPWVDNVIDIPEFH